MSAGRNPLPRPVELREPALYAGTRPARQVAESVFSLVGQDDMLPGLEVRIGKIPMLRLFLKDENMKTWLLYGGMIGAGLLALFGGSRWFSSDDPPEPAETLSEAAQFSELENIAPTEPPAPQARTEPAARLQLNLPPGQPLPLWKSVEQVLIQKTPDGDRLSHSSLQLEATIRLEEKTPDGSQLVSVVYNRVRYRQDLAGRSFAFDSTVPSGPLPVEALPYQGLVGNGFSFWIGKDHRILKPVGFADFLKRCIRDVPPAQQQRVQASFSETTDEGVANFIDDSLGFLPPNPEVEVESSWTRERQVAKPVPLLLSSRCTLRRLTPQFAEVDIAGTIAHPKSFSPEAWPAGDLQVIVRGGHSKGRCEIDRQTGLPLHAEIKRFVDMEVRLASGQTFDQQKITTTTIRLFPRETSPAPSGVVPASAEFPARN